MLPSITQAVTVAKRFSQRSIYLFSNYVPNLIAESYRHRSTRTLISSSLYTLLSILIFTFVTSREIIIAVAISPTVGSLLKTRQKKNKKTYSVIVELTSKLFFYYQDVIQIWYYQKIYILADIQQKKTREKKSEMKSPKKYYDLYSI